MEEHKWRVSAIIWTGCGENYSRAPHTDTNMRSNCEGQFHLQFLPVHFNFVISNQSASPLLWHKGNYASKLQHRFNTVACLAFLTQTAHLHSLRTESVISCQWWAFLSVRVSPARGKRNIHSPVSCSTHMHTRFASSRGISKLTVMSFSQSK